MIPEVVPEVPTVGTGVITFLDKYPMLQNKYLQTVLIILLSVILARVITYIIEKGVAKLAAKTKTKVDDLLIEVCRMPFVFVLFMFGVKLSLVPLGLGEELNALLVKTVNTIIYLGVFYTVYKAVGIIVHNIGKKWAAKTESTIDDALLPIIEKSGKAIAILLGILFVLSEWKIDISGILAGMGIAGLALGFAVKDSLANIFGGISLILDKALKVGDVVKLDSGEVGTVVDVGLRSTRIRNWDNELVVVPNGALANSRIQNYKLPDVSVRVVIPFGVEYGSDVEHVKKTVLDSIKKIKTVVRDNPKRKPAVDFMNMGDSALDFRLRFYVKEFSQRFETKIEATTAVYNALNKAGIGIPFPTRTVYMAKEK